MGVGRFVQAILLLLIVPLIVTAAYSQESDRSTFQESAQIIVDRTAQDAVVAVTLQSTDVQEISIPAELERALLDDPQVRSIVFTNYDPCILGVSGSLCVLVNTERNVEDGSIEEIRETAMGVAGAHIDLINAAFGTDAGFHSVFVHSDDSANRALGTSGSISGRGAVSVAYTMPAEHTGSLFGRISEGMLSRQIQDGGGFYDVAKAMSQDKDASVTVSLIPIDTRLLMQLRISTEHSGAELQPGRIDSLDILGTELMQRSDVLTSGFNPLSSLIHVVILSDSDISISPSEDNLIPTRVVDGEVLPSNVTKSGWIMDPAVGSVVEGLYIFGQEESAARDDLVLLLEDVDPSVAVMPPDDNTAGGNNTGPDLPDEGVPDSILVVAIIAVCSVAAAIFYLKGYRQ